MQKNKHRITNYLITLIIFAIVIVFSFHAVEARGNNNSNSQQRPRLPMSNILHIRETNRMSHRQIKHVPLRYPTISAITINRFIEDKIAAELYNFKKQISDNHVIDHDVVYQTQSQTYLNNDNILSILVSFDVSTTDQMHSSRFYRTFNFDLQRNREVFVNNFFRPSFTYVLSDYVRNHIKSTFELSNDTEQLQFLRNTSPFISNFKNILFTTNGLMVHFNSQEIIKSITQDFAVFVPYDDLQEYMISEIVKTHPPTQTGNVIEVIAQRVVDPNRPMIALTFDDGPTNHTNQILEVLFKYNSAATFFVVGSRVNNYPHVMKRIVETGSEVANHTWSHPFLTRLSSSQIFNEIESTNRVIHSAVGVTPTLIRPPYGAMNDDVVAAYPTLQYIMWNVDTSDWNHRNADVTTSIIKRYVSDGAIVLMHDLVPSTAQSMEVIIPYLVSRGYQLVTVSELLEARGITSQIVYSGLE
jgi:peptidoglycan-N-acetylglucosamine deacetylase